jgi:hypothetical protein
MGKNKHLIYKKGFHNVYNTTIIDTPKGKKMSLCGGSNGS